MRAEGLLTKYAIYKIKRGDWHFDGKPKRLNYILKNLSISRIDEILKKFHDEPLTRGRIIRVRDNDQKIMLLDSDPDKFAVLNKFDITAGDETLITTVLEKYGTDLDSIAIQRIINVTKSFDLKETILDKYADILEDSVIAGIISQFALNDLAKCKMLLEKYQSRINMRYFAETVCFIAKHSESYDSVIDEYKSVLGKVGMGYLIESISRGKRDLTKNLIDKYYKQISVTSILKVMHKEDSTYIDFMLSQHPDLSFLYKCSLGEVNAIDFSSAQIKKEYMDFLSFHGINISEVEKQEEMVELAQYLMAHNNEIFQTLDVNLLQEKYLFLFEEISTEGKKVYPLLRKIGNYTDIQTILLEMPDENLTLFKDILDEIVTEDYDYTILLNRVLQSLQKKDYKDLFQNIRENINTCSAEQKKSVTNALIYILSKQDPVVQVKSMTDLLEYQKKIEDYVHQICDNSQNYTIQDVKNAILEKRYGLSLKDVESIIKRYASDLDHGKIKLNETDQKIVQILEDLKHIVTCINKDELLQVYHHSNINISKEQFHFDFSSRFEAQVRAMYARSLNSSLLHVESLSEISSYSNFCNQKIYRAFDCSNPKEFYILLTAIGAYSHLDSLPQNIKEDWNRPKESVHCFCSSLISNQMMGTANIKFACLGFDFIQLNSLLLQAPFDISSNFANKQFDTAAQIDDSRLKFLFPNKQIDYTRHTHNELVIERALKIGKVQPSYAIYMTEEYSEEKIKNFEKIREKIFRKAKRRSTKPTTDDIIKLASRYIINGDKRKDFIRWYAAMQAANDFSIPMVVVERKPIHEYERKKLEEMTKEFEQNHDSQLLKELLTRYENNRAGSREYWNLEGFKEKDIEAVVNLILNNIQQMINSGNMEDAKACTTSFLEWLDTELNEKLGKKYMNIGKKELGFQPEKVRNQLVHLDSKISESLEKERDKKQGQSHTLESNYSWMDALKLLDSATLNLENYDQALILLQGDQFTIESAYNKLSDSSYQKPMSQVNEEYARVKETVKEAIQDPLRNQIESSFSSKSHGSRHIENVILFAAILGCNGIVGNNKERLQTLAVEAAKYHDSKRSTDGNAPHAEESAKTSYQVLKEQGYSKLELAIIYTAIKNHDFRKKTPNYSEFKKSLSDANAQVFKDTFMNLVYDKNPWSPISYTEEEYQMQLSKQEQIMDTAHIIEDVEQVVTCVRDADALDRTRFISHSRASLNPIYLSDYAKGYVDFSLRLAELQSMNDLTNLLRQESTDMKTITEILENPNFLAQYNVHYRIKTPKELIKVIRDKNICIESKQNEHHLT